MGRIKHESCPNCDSQTLNECFKGTDYSHTGEAFTVVSCNDCSFTFTQDAPDQNSIGKYYESDDYVSHSDTQKGLFYSMYHLVRKYMLGQKRKMIEKSSTKGKLLDIGCGTGYFLNEMKEHSWHCEGIEQDEKTREYGVNKFKLDINAPSHLASIPNASLQVVSMWHVLEHVHNLGEQIQQIHKALDAKGTLVVAVPNRDSYDAKKYKKYWAAWDLPIHLWHFTPDTMAKVMAKNGFKVVKHHRLPFDSFYVSILSEKYKVGSSFKGILIGGISFLKCLFNVKKCSSVVYILKKT